MYKIFSIIGVLLSGFIIFVLLNLPELQESGQFVAYRGGGQLVDYEALENEGCTARSIIKSENSRIENTVESISDAISAGFDVIHINIHRTKDNSFVLFHDWTLDCATNGKGVIGESTVDLLAELDAGYGYTFDGGEDFPFREKGFRIRSLVTILDEHSNMPFWLNLKNNDEVSFAALHQMLKSSYANRLSDFVIFTSEKGEDWFRQEAPELTTISTESTKSCIKKYMLFGWSGVFPDVCSNRPILIPPSKTKYLWGYPRRFSALAQENGSSVYLWTQHTSLKSHRLEIENGVGVVTGDINGVNSVLR